MTGQETRPSVSIVIPAYNASLTLSRAVQSALRQRAIDVHVIIVDHGSRDNSADVARALRAADDRVRLVELKRTERERLSASRPLNAGLRLAVTDMTDGWVVRLDADDVFADDDVLAGALALGSRRPLIAGLLRLYDPISNYAVSYGPRAELRDRRSLLRSGGAYALGHHAMLIHGRVLRSLFEKGELLDEETSYGEDLDASLRLLSSVTDEEFIFVPITITDKFLGAGTITSTLSSWKILADQVRVLIRHGQPKSLLFRVVLYMLLTQPGPALPWRRTWMTVPAELAGAIDSVDIAPIIGRLVELSRVSEDTR